MNEDIEKQLEAIGYKLNAIGIAVFALLRITLVRLWVGQSHPAPRSLGPHGITTTSATHWHQRCLPS